MKPHHVYIDPGGSTGRNFYVIVAAPTGVTYETQCGGHSCLQRKLEGFLVPLPPWSYDDTRSNIETELTDFFQQHFQGWPGEANVWPDQVVGELAALIHRIEFWVTPSGGLNERAHLTLDRSKLGQCTDAWIPVLTPDGSGIVTFDNSD